MPGEDAKRVLGDERRYLHLLIEHVDDLQRHGSTDVDAALSDITAHSAATVPGAKYAGITVLDPDGSITTIGPTDGAVSTIDDIQRETGQGPCLSAAWNQHTIVIDDVEREPRWSAFCAAVHERTSIRSMLSFRLYDERRGSAALSFHADTAGVFDDESVEVGLLYAAHTTLAWNTLRREQQFQSALASRDVIGQAKGVLMERFDIDAVAAFELIRKLSQESNTKIADVARRLVGRNRS